MFTIPRKKISTQVEFREINATSDSLMSNSEVQEPTPKLFTYGTPRAASLAYGQHLHRYWIRGIVGIIVPVAITTYWFAVWYIYFIPQAPGSPIEFGHDGGRWIFYSWFLIGVFGMNLAKYGLLGVEASMMMDRRWAAKNAMQVMMHNEHSWSGPSGWMKCIRDMFIRKRGSQPPTPLWALLAFLSILPFVAIPLTGLSYEMKEGYHNTNRHPMVKGLQWDNINFITWSGVSAGLWKGGVNDALPGLGVVYTPRDGPASVDRSKYPNLNEFPNSLPVDDGIAEAFVTSQADVPISGNTWGLAIRYNCTTVTNLSEFTILDKRKKPIFSSTDSNLTDSESDFEWTMDSYFVGETNSSWISVRNATGGEFSSLYADNFAAMMEEGVSLWPPDSQLTDYNLSVSNDCYFWGQDGIEQQYPGLDQEQVYEAIIWQSLNQTVISGQNKSTQEKLTFDPYLDSNLTELYNNYTMRWTPFEYDQSLDDDQVYDGPMSAIGVRCTVASAVGTADIDGRTSTYTNFKRTDTRMPFLETCALRIDVEAPANVIEDSTVTDGDWINNIFRSINTPVPFTTNWTSKDDPNNDNRVSRLVQLSYLNASDLRRALLRTYPAAVNEFMYNGGLGFSNETGLHTIQFTNYNVTAFEIKKIFEYGDIKFWISGVIIIIWAALSVLITLIYGFRRRWSATLDGYSMFRFGADLAEKIRDRPEFGVNMGFEDCYVLREIPGLIGDANMGFEPGHITLVEGKRAITDKGKLYM